VGLVSIGCLALVLGVAACGSSSDSGASSSTAAATTSTSGSSGGAIAALKAQVDKQKQMPTTVLATKLGPFKPKPGGKIFNIACNEAIVGCHILADHIRDASKALGYSYTGCDSGPHPDGPNKCFTNAVNAKPSVIVINGVGSDVAGDGYAAAKKAGIPVVGMFTGNPADGSVSQAEVASTGCADEGKVLADTITVDTNGKANALFLGEQSIGCDVQRETTFKSEYKKQCPDCSLKILQFDSGTVETSLPQQLQASLNQNPNVNWVVGVYDQAASIAVTQIQQAGKQDSINVAGMDGNPANVELVLKGQVQKYDLAFGQGEDSWSGVDAAARIYSGKPVPRVIPVNTFLVTKENATQLGKDRTWPGPTGFRDQFKKLWGVS
jgi:ribose transport system substrate-binding protein